MERVFGFHGGLHIAEALRARAEFRPCGENPGHGVLLPVDLQLLAQDHESPALGINGHTAHGVFPDFRQMRGIREAFRNHFGESAAVDKGRPVTGLILERLPVTVSLNLLAILVTYLLAIPLGIFSAVRPDTKLDNVITFFLFFQFLLKLKHRTAGLDICHCVL